MVLLYDLRMKKNPTCEKATENIVGLNGVDAHLYTKVEALVKMLAAGTLPSLTSVRRNYLHRFRTFTVKCTKLKLNRNSSKE